jgi:hypothetical protein
MPPKWYNSRRKHFAFLIFSVTLRDLTERIPPPLLLVHLLVRRPAENAKREYDEKPTGQGRGGKGLVEIVWQELVYNRDDEDCEKRGDG